MSQEQCLNLSLPQYETLQLDGPWWLTGTSLSLVLHLNLIDTTRRWQYSFALHANTFSNFSSCRRNCLTSHCTVIKELGRKALHGWCVLYGTLRWEGPRPTEIQLLLLQQAANTRSSNSGPPTRACATAHPTYSRRCSLMLVHYTAT